MCHRRFRRHVRRLAVAAGGRRRWLGDRVAGYTRAGAMPTYGLGWSKVRRWQRPVCLALHVPFVRQQQSVHERQCRSVTSRMYTTFDGEIDTLHEINSRAMSPH